jgi:hypothetical protein
MKTAGKNVERNAMECLPLFPDLLLPDMQDQPVRDKLARDKEPTAAELEAAGQQRLPLDL